MNDGNINGGRVRELRKAHGLSLRGLAARVGCTHPCIVQIEKGGGASIALARRLADAFGVRIDYLTTRDDPQPVTPPASAEPRPAARASPG